MATKTTGLIVTCFFAGVGVWACTAPTPDGDAPVVADEGPAAQQECYPTEENCYCQPCGGGGGSTSSGGGTPAPYYPTYADTNNSMRFSALVPQLTSNNTAAYGKLRITNIALFGGARSAVGGICLVQRAPSLTTQSSCLNARPSPDGNGTPNFGQNYAYWIGGKCYFKYSGPYCNVGLSATLGQNSYTDFTTPTASLPSGTGSTWHSIVAANVQPFGCGSSATEYNTSYCRRAVSSGVTAAAF